ncbi:formate dehydrogenase subunit delta [Herbaspirillum sp. RTI4]|uniref:formate dehydrogenase subunit delta n=1 Tax=Herbaspirillum sp. RTI4 TaxID=3048640 RepID=UPI002AB4551B|nr:formate dehydrogenase subunit delta [Herbaspirillum sp. RTI4]MDY7579843.1 formate dehydrogenase subunit delta [Herbaspirillum sp. RTI4]MEA9981930.1 formate dehydrogenase subunit delta [Herbaspirillum sp. RTI4]
MDVHNLVKMANQIGSFFETMPDREQAIEDLGMHLRRSWETRMRVAFMKYIEEENGAGLSEIVLEAVKRHKAMV